MIRRNYLGLDICENELRVVSLRKKRGIPTLTGAATIPLDAGVYAPSVREPNVRDVKGMAEKLREVLLPLAGREDRLALALPDSSGRILITDIETPISSPKEGEQIVRWHLKKNLGLELKNTHLDFQILEQTGSAQRLMVALISDSVLQQFETILENLGFFPRVIDFHSLCLFNYYASRVSWEDSSLLIGIEENTFSLHYLQRGAVVYHHVRPLNQIATFYPEFSRILAGCRGRYPESEKAKIFLQSDREDLSELLPTIRPVLGAEPHLLDLRSTDSLESSGVRLSFSLLPAIAAAERMMR